ncbi:hypothetical protein [uncultured Schumannella sp.]|uniref:hypothetical protein n=1 Tax=uncultured Schumannella sp. TaxID=1195956 RepID=UPI0025D8AB57|nr:hypothetical protein [uncultured Schumannella sp.]
MRLPRALRPPIAALSRTRLFRSIGPTIMPWLERVHRGVTRHRAPLSDLAVPSLVLHTIGARRCDLAGRARGGLASAGGQLAWLP